MSYCTYQLHILVNKKLKLQIGKLGEFEFPEGRYIYTGSARKNMPQRIQRHLSDEKKLRWHIDYLLINKAVKVTKVTYSDLPECEINQSVKGKVIIKSFGASDCKNRCQSHLKILI